MENAYLLVYIRRDPSEAADAAFHPCSHCHEEASVMDKLKARMALKNLGASEDFKKKQAQERKGPAKTVSQLFP